jgi:hypothetical protein
MRIFLMFYPLVLLVIFGLVIGWVIPDRRARKHDSHDIDAVLDSQRQALRDAREEASDTIRVARQANRELRSAERELERLADLRQQSKGPGVPPADLRQHSKAS